MKEKKSEIEIPLDFIELNLKLFIYGNSEKSLYLIDKEIAFENGMSPYQILEGNFYNYYFKLGGHANHQYQLIENLLVKHTLRKDVSEGRISPNIFVGSLPLTVYNKSTGMQYPDVNIEVLATKLDDDNIPKEDPNYQKNYQFMLKDIAEKCTELLMQINSPITQNFEINFDKNNETIYQRFAFVSALINTNEFDEAVHKIIASPTTKWLEELELKGIRSVRRMNSFSIRQIASRSNRFKLATPIGNLYDVPSKIETTHKSETTDTPENRFIKHALEVFLQFCIACRNSFIKYNYSKSKIEAEALVEKLENHLNHPFFKEIERPTTLKLNSPALQRKSGYRELLNAWLQFDLAAKLIWKGGDDVYKAGKRDIAVLYEYWLFFVLYDLMKTKFKINDNNTTYKHLIEPTDDGLNVMVKSGKLTALEGTYKTGGRELHIKFSYNRTFDGGAKYNKKNKNNSFSGSWTKALRPDYTLSIWPEEIKDEEEAEKNEKIVHIHFDSKYKVQQFTIKTDVEQDVKDSDEDLPIVNNNDESKIDSLEKEKRDERKGIYKNADLLKMHAYKDAIRRTGGAYVLYPGDVSPKPMEGFHEIIPGLGAFAIRPKEGENGTTELGDFLDKIIAHFNNMASQQRRHSNTIYKIHKDESPRIVNDPMPDYIIPDEINIIVGYYKSEEHLAWIEKEMKYNGRIGNARGAMSLTAEFIGANYLILHNERNPELLIYKIDQEGNNKPTVISSQDELFTSEKHKYPNSTQPFYLVFNLLIKEEGFLNGKYNIESLSGYSKETDAFPFTCKLSELINPPG
jgi:predicted component of viral defense system (DUF524 family)